MSFLTEQKAFNAWAFNALHAENTQAVAVGELADAYTRDVNVNCFLPAERDAVVEGLLEACSKYWGIAVARKVKPSENEKTVLQGISFRPPEKIYGKPVLYVASSTTLNPNSGFNEKGGLSTIGVGNCGNACAFSCAYCSSGAVMERNPQSTILRVLGVSHEDVVVRRLGAVETARRQLTAADGTPRFLTPGDSRIVEIASLVDPLPTPALAEETYRLAKVILELTHWRIRILTKSALLGKFARRFDEAERQRLLLGFSIGIPDDDVAKVVEKGTTFPSTRFRIHRELLAEGFRMFGMACPVLPVPDFRALAERIAEQIQPDRLEQVWCEAVNRRGDSLLRTTAALQRGGFTALAQRLAKVSRSEILWEIEYNREAFLGFHGVIPEGKLAFLTYTNPSSEAWWSQYARDGAVLL
ncbi:MAG: hypothetical protein P4L99_25520 [Chthoniobacter sp.]|nr:hypothetical protein [Chthoniobacter sp.]